MRGVSESLAGRVGIINLLGFSSRERHQRDAAVSPFLPTLPILAERQPALRPSGLDEVYRNIWTGGFPGLVAGPIHDRELFYSSYLQTYLDRDLRAPRRERWCSTVVVPCFRFSSRAMWLVASRSS